MNQESEVFEIPVMVPGNFPVYVPVQVSTEEQIAIMNHELTEADLIKDSVTEEFINTGEPDPADVDDMVHPMLADHNGADIPGQINYDPEQEKEIMEEIANDLFVQEQETEQEKPVKSFSCVMSGERYKELFSSIGILVAETVLHITNEGIKTAMVDTANVALVKVDYKLDNFEKYELSEPFDLGIDIAKFLKLKTMVKKGSLVKIEYNELKNRIVVDIDGTETQLYPLDPTTIRKEPGEPPIELKQRIEFLAGEFIQGIKEGSKISDKVSLSLDNGAFMMSFEGDTDSQKKKVPVSSWTPNIPAKRSLFSIDYLKDMVKVMDKKEKVVFYMDQDHPFKMIRERNGTEIMWMLAPRIEAD